MSFYRTYRPQIIEEIDNSFVRDQLLSLLTKDKKNLPHAYLFEGPKGSGKTTAARIVAKLFNCEKSKKKGPCGMCSSCISIAHGTSIDVLEIDAASNRGIDDVRDLRDRIKLSPAVSPYKIYIIDEVHMMTSEAFNALLKTLEEPPPHAVFILATTDPLKVPATVRSRCMEIVFAKAKKEELIAAISRIVSKEKIAIDDGAVAAIAEISDGAFRDAVKLLEQVSFIQGKITREGLMHVISKSEESKREAFLSAVLGDKDLRKSLEYIEEFVRQGADMRAFLTDCLRDLQNDLIAKIQDKEIYREKPWHLADIQSLIKKLSGAYEELRTSPIPQLPIELAVVEFLEIQETPEAKHEKYEIKKHDEQTKAEEQVTLKDSDKSTSSDHLNLDKLTNHWSDFIESLKSYNHSVAGVVRGTRPKSVEHGVVTIEAFYPFHQERLSEGKVRAILSEVLKKLFGVNVKVEIVLGRK